MKKIEVTTQAKQEVISITQQINNVLAHTEMSSGICIINALHTTVGLTVADLDPGMDLDMLDALNHLIPKLSYRHAHDPTPQHVGSHIMSAIIGTNLTLPIENNKLILGTWQEVILIELDGPQARTILVSIF